MGATVLRLDLDLASDDALFQNVPGFAFSHNGRERRGGP